MDPDALARRFHVIVVCLTMIAGSVGAASAQDFVLTATAGLDGLVKSGRWTPVQIQVQPQRETTARDVRAELVVTWGDAVVRRHVMIGPSPRRFEVFLRTADPVSHIRVGLEGHAAPVDVPVTVLPYDAVVTLCVGAIEASAGQPSCSVSMSPQELPTSPRAFEIVDEVIQSDAIGVPAPARAALDRWRSVRAMEISGDLSLTPQVTRPLVRRGLPQATASAMTSFAVTCALGLLVIGFFVATPRLPMSVAWLAFGVTTVAATGAAAALGRAGPGSEVVVHHNTLVQQIPSAGGALLSTRGVAEFPSNDQVQLQFAAADGMVEATTASARAEQVLDESGSPTLAGRFGLGARQAFVAEAIVEESWLDVTEHGRNVRIASRAQVPLHDCRFADGMSVSDVGDLGPGQVTEAVRQRDITGPLFTCTMSSPAVRFRMADRPVVHLGTTTIAVYSARESPTRLEAPND